MAKHKDVGRYRAASENKKNYTQTRSGRMSVDGKTAGGVTQAFTDPNSGKVGRKGQMVSRRKRYYDVRVGLGLSGG